jgi:pyridinium-3,5-biscarboxylic acid mononucleotide sulfurtransferase
MSDNIFEKYEGLKHLIRSYKKVGVAFSGGIDSSLLLLATGEVLGKSNVVALHGRSQLSYDESEVETLYQTHFSSSAQLKIIELFPLTWPEFVNNDNKRCYYCKKMTYTAFKNHLSEIGVEILLDGTNFEDLCQNRAGLPVLRELDIRTPLADKQFRKKEIRFLAKMLGLPNYNLSSNSCLATRLSFLPKVDENSLLLVKKLEAELKKMGFKGCRARPDALRVVIELRQQDFIKFSYKHNRLKVVKLCRKYGFDTVFLDILGRV